VLAGNTLDWPLRFSGQYLDSETGWHYNYFRDHEPEVGRYLQSDPIGLDDGVSTYGYVYSRPVEFIDRSGRNGVSVGGAIAAGAIAGGVATFVGTKAGGGTWGDAFGAAPLGAVGGVAAVTVGCLAIQPGMAPMTIAALEALGITNRHWAYYCWRWECLEFEQFFR
jgi:RHS repeat-associated protein